MKLERLSLKGLSTAFPAAVDLALGDLPSGLIALVGPNGHGKTMLLEATPGALYRQLPARDGKDPVLYATGRDSYIAEEFTVEGVGTFRVRLSLDGPKRQSDAVLEQRTGLGPDFTWVPLNDGKRSTYDAAVAERMPSFDLFINSAFAAQGRGDEFTRRKPSQRKDLFVEFLALQHYAVKAAAAAEAAELYADARLRLTAVIEQLEKDTADGILDALERQANALQVTGGQAQIRQRELTGAIADLEARLALLADQVAANTAAAERLRQVKADRESRQRELADVENQRRTVGGTLIADTSRITSRRDVAIADAQARAAAEIRRIEAKRDTDVADIDTRIAGNQQILGMADQIRDAVAALKACRDEEGRVRSEWTERTAELRQAETTLRDAEKALAALAPIEDRVTRATRDASLLETVPCGGAGEYAACQFLKDAAAAREQLADLKARLEPKAQLADAVGAALRDAQRLTDAVKEADGRIAACLAKQTELQKQAKYAEPLAEASARIESYRTSRAKAIDDAAELVALARSAGETAVRNVTTDADAQLADAQRRHDERVIELDAAIARLTTAVADLTTAFDRAGAELARTQAGNVEATTLQAELALARRQRDQAIAEFASADSGRQELTRRREEIADKQSRLEDLRSRRARIEQDLVEWRDLAKALGKGGLPDLEIDQAGPTISATTNAILLDCFGPRFSIELVTQVEKADGGMKDEFTVRVMDNERAGGWRDISDLSGGQKVIVQEALMCAISIYVNERSAMPIRTLWRDETGAALDPVNAIAYVRMLRKVRELGGFHHVYFISHNPDAAALADAQIVVGDGQARIVLPPFAEVAA